MEVQPWDAADKLRGNQEPAQYKHVVLGLVFLKYVSDAFEKRRRTLAATLSDPDSEDCSSEARRERLLESRDEYTSHNVFWMPDRARWDHLQVNAKPAQDRAVRPRRDGPHRKGEPDAARRTAQELRQSDLDNRLLGELIDQIGGIGFTDVDHGSDDVLGKV